MTPTKRARGGRSGENRWPWRLLFAGVAAEWVLIFLVSGAHWAQVFVALAWSIVTWVSLLWWVGYLTARLSTNDPPVRGLLVGVPLFTGLLSWGCRLASGHFGDIETLRFGLGNARMIGLYILQTEPLRAGAYLVGAMLLTFFWVRLATRSATTAGWRISPLAVGLTVLGAVAAGLVADTMGSGPVRVWGGQPLASFVGRQFEPQEQLADCLSEGDLTPRETPRSRSSQEELTSVVWVAVESLRSDVVSRDRQGRPVMPTLQHVLEEGLYFSNVWAASTHSDYSDVSALSSTYPLRSRRHVYYRPGDSWPKPLIWEALAPYGYESALISAQNEGWGGMEHFLRTDGLGLLWDSRDASEEGESTRAPEGDEAFSRAVSSNLRAGKVDDAIVVDQALEWLGQRTPSPQPYFLALNFQSSHFPYELARDAPRPFSPWEFDFEPSFTWYPPEATEVVRNAYFNALAYIDIQLGRLLSGLDELGLSEETMVVIYGENGESFHENGQVTHAGAPFEPALRVPVVLRDPIERRRETVDYPMSLVDLAPTLVARLGIEGLAGWQGVDVLHPTVASEDRVIYFHNENPISSVDGGVLGGRFKYWHDREIDRALFFDLASDPKEAKTASNSAAQARLSAAVADFRCRQLRYYENPVWPLLFEPPQVPPSRQQ